mmetsp:Transcript_43454/g.87877  ORF Transcript_43454/g.87877 Transcript_43454/m.87877 type:complete len:240 (+) Transcript_43454:393-1112(+)
MGLTFVCHSVTAEIIANTAAPAPAVGAAARSFLSCQRTVIVCFVYFRFFVLLRRRRIRRRKILGYLFLFEGTKHNGEVSELEHCSVKVTEHGRFLAGGRQERLKREKEADSVHSRQEFPGFFIAAAVVTAWLVKVLTHVVIHHLLCLLRTAGAITRVIPFWWKFRLRCWLRLGRAAAAAATEGNFEAIRHRRCYRCNRLREHDIRSLPQFEFEFVQLSVRRQRTQLPLGRCRCCSVRRR